MDRRERIDDPIEAQRAALEGKQAEIWTSLPGIVESFDPKAVTVTVQPTIKGSVQDEKGFKNMVNMPLLVDVPVLFPCGGGFTMTYPVKKGDECLVVFASRCIDGWWQSGGISAAPEERMHDLSDGFAIVGPRSQPRTLLPIVDTSNLQLRTDDGKAHVTMMPDYTIRALNPEATVNMQPDGEISMENHGCQMKLTPAGALSATAKVKISLDAPTIEIAGAQIDLLGTSSINMLTNSLALLFNAMTGGSVGGGSVSADFGNVELKVKELVGGGVKYTIHIHDEHDGGATGVPR